MEKVYLDHLEFTELATNFIGCLHGVAKYYNYPFTQQWLMAGSGMAFFMNIHKDLCPSGPYVFDYSPFYRLITNCGIIIEDIGFIHGDHLEKQIQEVEPKMKALLVDEIPMIIQNMDNQLIRGYNESAFLLNPHPEDLEEYFPKQLSFGSWNEFSHEMHAMIMAVKKTSLKFPRLVIEDAIQFAITTLEGNYSSDPPGEGYATGLDAYKQWLAYLEDNEGNNHGHWWNGTVWGECRDHASKFFRDLPYIEEKHDISLSKELSINYKTISEDLLNAREKSLEKDKKIAFLRHAYQVEEQSLPLLKKLGDSFK